MPITNNNISNIEVHILASSIGRLRVGVRCHTSSTNGRSSSKGATTPRRGTNNGPHSINKRAKCTAITDRHSKATTNTEVVFKEGKVKGTSIRHKWLARGNLNSK